MRQPLFLREAVSHAWTSCLSGIMSLLMHAWKTDWTHTTNSQSIIKMEGKSKQLSIDLEKLEAEQRHVEAPERAALNMH